MSLAYTLSNAMTGLSMTSKAAEIVSNNVANTMTEGYARRELDLSANTLGGRGAGVSVDGIRRVVNEGVLRDRRLSDAAVGQSSVQAEFHAALERLIGTPEDSRSLTGLVDSFERSLIEASSRPENETRLQAIADAATALTSHLKGASDAIQQHRMDADAGIASQVETLNSSLTRIYELNQSIVRANQTKQDDSAFLDMRQRELDKIASIVPLKVVQREHGAVAVFTTNGERLLDSKPVTVEFTSTRIIDSSMSQAGGELSGLSIGGRPIATGDARDPLSGGSLSALFAVRDDLAVAAQGQLDAIAGDLIERFDDVDPTLGAGESGLFTASLAIGTPGLASSLEINAAIANGEFWRLRDGLGASATEDVGNSTLLQAMADALSERRPGASGIAQNRSVSEIASHIISGIGTARQSSEATLAGVAGQQTALQSLEAADGVDTDAEMQKLMLIEQAYAANARVISVADELMQILLGL